MKTCNKCNEEKELTEFNKRKTSKDGYMNKCKSCITEYNKLYYSNNIETFKEKNLNYNINNKQKVSSKKKEYYIENKYFILIKRKKYYLNNRDEIKIKDRKYVENNREKVNKYNCNYVKNRKDKDKLYKLTANIRCLIYKCFRNLNVNKNNKTESIIGCDFIFFREYIESKFENEMTWENYGDWHLDHIIPISYAINEEQLYTLNHYTNFQPLWMIDNCSKGNRYIG